MEKLLTLIYEQSLESWSDRAEEAFAELFGGVKGRYPERARTAVQIRGAEIFRRKLYSVLNADRAIESEVGTIRRDERRCISSRGSAMSDCSWDRDYRPASRRIYSRQTWTRAQRTGDL